MASNCEEGKIALSALAQAAYTVAEARMTIPPRFNSAPETSSTETMKHLADLTRGILVGTQIMHEATAHSKEVIEGHKGLPENQRILLKTFVFEMTRDRE